MIDAPELLRFLQSEESRAVDNDLNDQRKTALEFYRGDLFGDEVDGRSKLRTRDVAEVIDYMLASILRTMVSGDKVVEFEPSNPAEDDVAQQITDRIHWNFLREQDGYSILRDGIKAGLLEKSGVWKSYVERPKVREIQRINELDLIRLGSDVVRYEAPEGIDVEDAFDVVPRVTESGEPEFDGFGQPISDVYDVFDAEVMVPGPPKFKDAAIPNDEFFVAPDARTLDTAIYLGNISRVSIADLIDMGYAEEDLATVWGDTNEAQGLRDARDEGRANKEGDTVRADLGRMVTLREEYARTVWQGQYQLIRVHRVGNTILSVEPARMQPYTLWCPFPMPHRLIGQSLADKVMDIQVTRSHMLRQAMDGLYIANAPRMLVSTTGMDENTIDDLLDVAPGGLVRYSGGTPPMPLVQPFTAGPAFEAMQIMSGEKESRTGITRLNQGIDADALNKTATGTALMQASGQQMEELVAREAANAIGEMFEKKKNLMTAEMEPHEFRTDGKVVEMDPSQWPADLRLAVRVGLGSGNKDKKLQSIMLLKQTQAEAIQLDPRMVSPEKAFETAKLVTSTLGLGPATQYFNDPAELEPQPEQPSPEVQAAQIKAAEAQADRQAKADQFMQELEFKFYAKQLDMEMESAHTVEEARLAYQRLSAEIMLKREQMMAKAATDSRLSSMRPGGSLAN